MNIFSHSAHFYWCCILLICGMLLFPLSIKPHTITVDSGDTLQQIWTIHWIQTAITSSESVMNAPTNYPYDKSLVLYQPLYTAAFVTLPFYLMGFTPLTVYNLALIGSFICSFIGVILLVEKITASRVAATVAGIGFAFSTTRFAHLPHLNLLSGFWIPFILYILFILTQKSFTKKQLIGYGSGLTCLVAAQLLADIYHAVFLGVILGIVLMYGLMTQCYTRQAWLLIGIACGMALLIVSPIISTSIQAQHELELSRSFTDHETFAGSLELYSVRFEDGTLWEPQTANARNAPFGVEDALWPGLIVLLLVGISLAIAPQKYSWYSIFVMITLIAIVWSLGPIIRLQRGSGGLANPLYSLVYKHIPLMSAVRVPPRWGLIVQLGLSVMAGYGLAALLQIIKADWIKHGIAIIVSILALVDAWHGPIEGVHSIALEPLPSVYSYLDTIPPATLLEFPMENIDETLRNRYVYYCMFHPHRLVNSAGSIEPQKYQDLKASLRSFPSKESLALLRDLGITYVNIHRWELSDWAEWQARLDSASGLKLIGSFDDQRHLLYEVIAPPSTTPYATILASTESQLVLYAPEPLWMSAPQDYYHANTTVPLTITGDTEYTTSLSTATALLPGVHTYSLANVPTQVSSIEMGDESFQLIPAPTKPELGSNIQIEVAMFNETLRAGETLNCMSYGRGTTTFEQLVWSVSFVDPEWHQVYKQDFFFDGATKPPHHWNDTTWTAFSCSIPIPMDTQPGEYFLAVGLFDPVTQKYIEISDAAGNMTQIMRVPQVITVHN